MSDQHILIFFRMIPAVIALVALFLAAMFKLDQLAEAEAVKTREKNDKNLNTLKNIQQRSINSFDVSELEGMLKELGIFENDAYMDSVYMLCLGYCLGKINALDKEFGEVSTKGTP